MVYKKKKKDPKRERGRIRFLIIFFPIILICLMGLVLFFYLSDIKGGNSPLLFEETYSTSSDLKKKIRLIDNKIYESCYENSIDEQDILFSVVRSKQVIGYQWDFTELLIRLDNEELAENLVVEITNNLLRLEPEVIYEKERISQDEYIYHIYALGFYTHRIILSPKFHLESHEIQPRISIIIDDLGYDRSMADSIITIDLPLSLSILPMAPYTSYVTRKALENGHDILLHLPMEPRGYPHLDPGPGALLMSMSEEEIRQSIDELLKQVPGVKGVNHHMGSYFTESRGKMAIVLSELKKRNLFYLDSRTTAQTTAYQTAKELGVPTANKSLFLDHDTSIQAIRYQMERLLGMARYHGTAIGIGHPHKETIDVLKKYEKKLMKDFKVVPISELVD